MDHFIEFPAELAKKIIQEWLSLQGLVRTDVAHCGSRRCRQWSSIIASGLQIVAPLDFMNFESRYVRDGLVKWIIARRIQLTHAALSQHPHMNRTEEYSALFVVAGQGLLSYKGDLFPEECDAIAAHCPNLTELCVVGDHSTSSLQGVLENCTKLTKLHFYGGLNLGETWNRLEQVYLPFVEDLSIEDIEITEDIVSLCRSCPNTKRLCISSPSWEDAERMSIEDIARCMPLLQAIEVVMYREPLSDADVLCLVQHCPHIRDVSFRSGTNLTDASLVPMVQAYRPAHLALERVTVGVLQALSECCASTLVSLNFSYCAMQSLAPLVLVAERCTRLQSLKLFFWDPQSTLSNWDQLFSQLHNIECLDISNAMFNSTIATVIAQNCPKLAHLSVLHPLDEEFNSDHLLDLLRGCPLLVSVHVDRKSEVLRGIRVPPWTPTQVERAKLVLFA